MISDVDIKCKDASFTTFLSEILSVTADLSQDIQV